MIGGTKKAELDRSAKLVKDISEKQNIYFTLMFLIDSGYDINEIKLIAERLKPKSKTINKLYCEQKD